MKLDVAKLRPVGISDRAFFQEVLLQKPTRSCECAFANLFLWQQPYQEEFTVIDNMILVVERRSGTLHFPIGKYPEPKVLAEICDAFADARIGSGVIYDVPEDYPSAPQFFTESSEEGEFDYIYDLRKLSEMNGSLLRKKRNLVRQFERNYPDAEFKAVTGENLPEVLALADELNGHLPQADFLKEEKQAMEMMSGNFRELGMGGLILYAGGRPAGFSIYSAITADTADIHFEKADHTVKGAPQMLTVQTARELLKHSFVYMNREQDMGEPGLRQAKRSLGPSGMVRRRTYRRYGKQI